MELEELVGEHILTGFDYYETDVETDDGTESVSCCRIELDGTVYLAIEDPNDGYRPMLGSLEIDTTPIRNKFPSVVVVGVLDNSGNWGIIEFNVRSTGKTIVRLGTDEDDEYYPASVIEFFPENMPVNANVKEKEQ